MSCALREALAQSMMGPLRTSHLAPEDPSCSLPCLDWVSALAAICLLATTVHGADDVQIQADVVYGHKDGMALTMDVIRPAKPNGAAVLLLQSGGWYSAWREPAQLRARGAGRSLDKGFTVFHRPSRQCPAVTACPMPWPTSAGPCAMSIGRRTN